MGDKNLLQICVSLGESALVSQGRNAHIMLRPEDCRVIAVDEGVPEWEASNIKEIVAFALIIGRNVLGLNAIR